MESDLTVWFSQILIIDDDGFWYLRGSTGNGFLVVSAIAVEIAG